MMDLYILKYYSINVESHDNDCLFGLWTLANTKPSTLINDNERDSIYCIVLY